MTFQNAGPASLLRTVLGLSSLYVSQGCCHRRELSCESIDLPVFCGDCWRGDPSGLRSAFQLSDRNQARPEMRHRLLNSKRHAREIGFDNLDIMVAHRDKPPPAIIHRELPRHCGRPVDDLGLRRRSQAGGRGTSARCCWCRPAGFAPIWAGRTRACRSRRARRPSCKWWRRAGASRGCGLWTGLGRGFRGEIKPAHNPGFSQNLLNHGLQKRTSADASAPATHASFCLQSIMIASALDSRKPVYCMVRRRHRYPCGCLLRAGMRV